MISENQHYKTGRAKFEAKDFEGALIDYNKAIEQEENPSLYSERGVVFFYLGQKERSLQDMNYAADIEPENPYRYSSRAYIRDSMGDTRGAIEDYERAIAIDPEDAIAHNNLGMLQEKLGYIEKSKKSFGHADTLAEVDHLLDNIRQEKGYDVETAVARGEKEEEPTRESLSLWALLRTTFFTKNGFREYLAFIRKGFKA